MSLDTAWVAAAVCGHQVNRDDESHGLCTRCFEADVAQHAEAVFDPDLHSPLDMLDDGSVDTGPSPTRTAP